MTDQDRLADLLNFHMKRASIGDQRLANHVNALNGNAHFISRSTIRNWRTGSALKTNSWRQLATVAVALELNETEANRLLKGGGCLSIQAFAATAQESESDQALFEYWRKTHEQPNESTAETDSATDSSLSRSAVNDRNFLKNIFYLFRFKVWWSIYACALAVACTVVIFSILSSGGNGEDGSKGIVVPVIRTVSLGKQCLIDLSVQPYDAIWVAGVNPDNCPELDIRHNYAGYERDDLVSWDEGIAQCWVNTSLERLWIGFDLSGVGEGWLRLTSHGDANLFSEVKPVTPTLWDAPEEGSKIIGKFGYDELAGNASKILLDFPKVLDPTTAYENGDFHLGGCWQAADRDGFRGLHFYWPHDTEL